MRRILLPIQETGRSLLALQYVKKHFSVEQAEIILVMVDEELGISAKREEEQAALAVLDKKLELIKHALKGYKIVSKGYIGKAGQHICKAAREFNADYIVMTKSAQPDMLSMIGKTANYVISNSPTNVLIISENKLEAGEYKGLIYKKAQATVNLRGQLGDKQSECLLPSVDADCNYHFEVTVGKIRFFHTAYNPETANWDLPPAGDQTASIDVVAGQKADIIVKANSVEGKADRIRIINRGMKQEAVFSYKITAAPEQIDFEVPAAGLIPEPEVISLEVPVAESEHKDLEPVPESEEPKTFDTPREEMIIEAPMNESVDSILGEETAVSSDYEQIDNENPNVEFATEEVSIVEIADAESQEELVEEIEIEEAVDDNKEFDEDAVIEKIAVENEEPEDVSDQFIENLFKEFTMALDTDNGYIPVPPVVDEEEENDEDPVLTVEPTPEPEYTDVESDLESSHDIDELFEQVPEPEPVKEVSVDELTKSFDDLFKQFATKQMDYVEEEQVDVSDDYI